MISFILRDCPEEFCEGSNKQDESCNTRKCGSNGEQISQEEELTEIKDKTDLMINECADGTHSCTASELCINEIEGFTCEDKEEIFEDGERFIVTSSIDFAPNQEKQIGALSTDFNFKITLDTITSFKSTRFILTQI